MIRVSFLRLFTAVAILSLVSLGCGGSEETVAEDEFLTDTGAMDEPMSDNDQYQQEDPAEDAPMEQDSTELPMPEPIEEGPTAEQLQSELDAIKTENIQLREENSALQQTNKTLTNKVSDLEAANAAMATKKPEPVTIQQSASAPGVSSPEIIRAYEAAVNSSRNRNYREAMSQFQTLLNTGIKDDYADNCHYWLGECSFQLKDYSQAIQHFQHVDGYKFSEKKDDAQIMIARSYGLLGDRAKARAEYQKLIDLYPTSEYVGRARAKLQ